MNAGDRVLSITVPVILFDNLPQQIVRIVQVFASLVQLTEPAFI
jgi:hypothetical protein